MTWARPVGGLPVEAEERIARIDDWLRAIEVGLSEG